MAEMAGMAQSNGNSAAHDLFALTDEQILEIEPEAQEAARSGEGRVASQETPGKTGQPAPLGQAEDATKSAIKADAATRPSSTSHESPVTSHAQAEPPHWVAEAMSDPQRGGEARAFWDGAQKAQQEAAAYREVFAKPEEARSAAERARVLDDIDRAYFGATGNSAEQTSAARAQLAQVMMRENPAAFREMVFVGLRALEEAGKTTDGKSVAQAFRPEGGSSTEAFATTDRKSLTPEGVSYSATGTSASSTASDASARHESQVTAYAAFEKSANEELEKSVGRAIERTIDQALPNIAKADRTSVTGAQHSFGSAQDRAAPLQARLQSAIRQEVEKALQGDRQLGEQIALIISGRRPGDSGTQTPRFDGETRAQVVRLIDERAKQLVPGAAKRVLQDWTQTTLATHRSRTRQNETAAARSDLAPANSDAASSRLQAGDSSRTSARNDNRSGKGTKVDYRKLSDEQILEM
jgi:hypothetical protein